MCQLNLSLVHGASRYKNHQYPIQEQDETLVPINEYFQQHHPINHQHKSLYKTDLLIDSNEIPTRDRTSISRVNWFKRDSRLPNQGNKRMLCFFHAVNCFG
ncbi:unnamed protein product [Adineta steineri]|uniref:Uncharacterized protein n=1 Tax=Adineta steineri TaxID=433720 RepID=A0A813QLM4_9BILA|nr:unnamed protein product [Adineta steineri]CAF0768845.1 unnamed protein product [Adineta steineri]